MTKKIAILNYGLGNVRSVNNALLTLGATPQITSDENEIMQSSGLIIPGVGAFPQAMTNLSALGIQDVIYRFIKTGRPVFGICLGMQLLFEKSYEFGVTNGLGLIPGKVEKIPVLPSEGRLPHIRWSFVTPSEEASKTMFRNLSKDEMRFYFVHSYAATGVSQNHLAATVSYLSHNMVAAVQSENIWGAQFHPEKSGRSGLQLIENFINKC
jgi:imidazole glycerol-phosphate synthase subunit HisH